MLVKKARAMFRARLMLMTALAAAPVSAKAATDIAAVPTAPRVAAQPMPPEMESLPPNMIHEIQCSTMEAMLEATLRQQGHTAKTADMAEEMFETCPRNTPVSQLTR